MGKARNVQMTRMICRLAIVVGSTFKATAVTDISGAPAGTVPNKLVGKGKPVNNINNVLVKMDRPKNVPTIAKVIGPISIISFNNLRSKRIQTKEPMVTCQMTDL